jgi:hypothetical protein
MTLNAIGKYTTSKVLYCSKISFLLCLKVVVTYLSLNFQLFCLTKLPLKFFNESKALNLMEYFSLLFFLPNFWMAIPPTRHVHLEAVNSN